VAARYLSAGRSGWTEPIAGIHQIVGHTPGDVVRKMVKPKSKNYCLDVRNASVAAVLADGKLEILEKT